eukprot:5376439-Prymnesium_polylepis.1
MGLPAHHGRRPSMGLSGIPARSEDSERLQLMDARIDLQQQLLEKLTEQQDVVVDKLSTMHLQMQQMHRDMHEGAFQS